MKGCPKFTINDSLWDPCPIYVCFLTCGVTIIFDGFSIVVGCYVRLAPIDIHVLNLHINICFIHLSLVVVVDMIGYLTTSASGGTGINFCIWSCSHLISVLIICKREWFVSCPVWGWTWKIFQLFLSFFCWFVKCARLATSAISLNTTKFGTSSWLWNEQLKDLF